MSYAAAAFAHIIESTLTFIVSWVAMNAASVAFLFSRLLQIASTPAPSQYGRWFVLWACRAKALCSMSFSKSRLCSFSLVLTPLPVSPICFFYRKNRKEPDIQHCVTVVITLLFSTVRYHVSYLFPRSKSHLETCGFKLPCNRNGRFRLRYRYISFVLCLRFCRRSSFSYVENFSF